MPRDGTATRERIIEAAERLVIDNGYAATSVDQVLAAAHTSKGAFFHHFDSKVDLARSLVDRYVAGDLAQLHDALAHAASAETPLDRVDAFLGFFEDRADELMAEQSSCLYIAVLTERQLVADGTAEPIRNAVAAWREAIVELVRAATREREGTGGPPFDDVETEALADHVFVTFEGAFLLARATGDPGHMRRQLGILRRLVTFSLRPEAGHRPRTSLPESGGSG